jgi:4a-hydroxytetrahydrobiopterin dehydratase
MKRPPLRRERCAPCRGASPLSPPEISGLWEQTPGWAVVSRAGVRRLEKAFEFRNFSEAMSFAVKIGRQAEREDHHPALLVEWGRVTVSWWTHAVKGLHRNDFIMAAKSDGLVRT